MSLVYFDHVLSENILADEMSFYTWYLQESFTFSLEAGI